MKLADIQAQPNTPLTTDEIFHVRTIIGVSDSVSDTYYMQSADKFVEINKRVATDGITAEQEAINIYKCREIRQLYKDYDNLGDGNLYIAGSSDGVNLSTPKDRMRLAIKLWNRIFPPAVPVPNEDIFTEMDALERKTNGTDNGTFASVPVFYNEIHRASDEYSG